MGTLKQANLSTKHHTLKAHGACGDKIHIFWWGVVSFSHLVSSEIALGSSWPCGWMFSTYAHNVVKVKMSVPDGNPIPTLQSIESHLLSYYNSFIKQLTNIVHSKLIFLFQINNCYFLMLSPLLTLLYLWTYCWNVSIILSSWHFISPVLLY